MSNNPFRGSIDLAQVSAMVYSDDLRIARLLDMCLKQINCQKVLVTDTVDAATKAIDDILPQLVIIVSDLHDPKRLADAQRINKKRARSKGRTPKVLALLKPSVDDIVKAKGEGFFDVLPLPVTPQTLFNRLETVLTRLD